MAMAMLTLRTLQAIPRAVTNWVPDHDRT